MFDVLKFIYALIIKQAFMPNLVLGDKFTTYTFKL